MSASGDAGRQVGTAADALVGADGHCRSLGWLVAGVTRVFRAAGVPAADAGAVAEHLVEAEASGVPSHGLMRVPQYLGDIAGGKVRLGVAPTVVSRNKATVVLAGGGGLGIVMARAAMDAAMAIAAEQGVGVASMRQCGHSGRLGAYTAQAARAGMAGVMMVNGGGAGQWMAPHGGLAGRLATNPLSIAVPGAGDEQLVVDLATSVAPEGKVRSHLLAGRPIPEGWVVSASGAATTDPHELYGPPQGALLPFGGHKGFALAMAVDALAGGLSGAGCCTAPVGAKPTYGDGILALAIRIEAFAPASSFGAEVSGLMQHVRSCPPIPGQQVLVPGEPERRQRERHAQTGLRLSGPLWLSLEQAAERIGVSWSTAGDDGENGKNLNNGELP